MDTLTNGLSQADFTLLRVLYNGGMTDILSLIGTLGGWPITAIQLLLSISGAAVLSIDLSSYSTTAQINAAITTALAPYVLTATLGSCTDIGRGLGTLSTGTRCRGIYNRHIRDDHTRHLL